MSAHNPHLSSESSNTTFVKPPHKRTITLDKGFNKLHQFSKEIYNSFSNTNDRPKTVFFIVGCQRSGTALLTRIFESDWHTKVYREVSRLSLETSPRLLRLKPLDEVEALLNEDKAPLIVLKPLVESQNILKLLDHFEGSKALWIYRHYKDVTASHIKKWGSYNSINDLKAIVEARPNSWRYENISDEIRDIVLQYFVEDMNPYDAAALYWFVRNSLYFELGLVNNPKILLCQYENLVSDPLKIMGNIYEFIGHDFPGNRIVKRVHSTSVRKGKNIHLSPEIDLLSLNLLEKLDKALRVLISGSPNTS